MLVLLLRRIAPVVVIGIGLVVVVVLLVSTTLVVVILIVELVGIVMVIRRRPLVIVVIPVISAILIVTVLITRVASITSSVISTARGSIRFTVRLASRGETLLLRRDYFSFLFNLVVLGIQECFGSLTSFNALEILVGHHIR